MGFTSRVAVVVTVLCLVSLCLFYRVFDLTVLERHFLLKQSEARIQRVVSMPAHRGIITDRQGKPLAISAQVSSAWVNPKLFHAEKNELALLATYLQTNPEKLAAKISRAKKRSFLYLKRSLPPETAAAIKAMQLDGVFLDSEYKRFYPEADVTAHVVGFTNIDDQGQEGLELAYDSWLRGVPGKKEVMIDREGHIVAELKGIREPDQGHDLTLTIDSRIQYLAYKELNAAIKKFEASAGSIVVVDVKTGEILAMVNAPSYNPNHIVQAGDGRLRNRAVTDQFEPGSTVKAFSVASFLASGKFHPEDVLHTAPGWININGDTIRDERNYGDLTVADVIKKSSNVGMSKMALASNPDDLWQLYRRLGFGVRTYSGYPGEVSGSLNQHAIWRPIEVATMAIGYGLAVTPLQLTQAFAVIANGGLKQHVHLVNTPQKIPAEQVLDSTVANNVILMLERVVAGNGTGRRARIPGFRVAGKTGTAYIAGPHGYDRKHYASSFVGLAPVSDPRLVISVVIQNPKHQHFGAIVAAPAFAKVMAGALRLLAIAPDNLSVS